MFSTHELNQLCLDVNNIAYDAGKKIKAIFNSTYEINYKDDKSPVTTADLVASEYILDQLKILTPELPSISEESPNLNYAARKNWSTFWLIDPLDGTRQFIKNKTDFTVNIALVHENQPILGVIYLPIEDIIYFASKNNNAWKQQPSSDPISIETTKQPQSMLRICMHTGTAGKRTQKFLHAIGEHEIISRGSSIKSCLVADGSADIYPRFGPTWEWDTAAAQCIIEEAGGMLTDLSLNKLNYNKESLLNPSFFAYGSKHIDWPFILKELDQ